MVDQKKPGVIVGTPLVQARCMVKVFDKDGNLKWEAPFTNVPEEMQEEVEDEIKHNG